MLQPDFVFREHQAAVNCVHFFADDLYLVSGDQSGLLIVWNMLLKRPLVQVANAHSDAIIAVTNVGTDTVISQGRDSKIKIWSLTASELSGDLMLAKSLSVDSLSFCQFASASIGPDTWIVAIESVDSGNAYIYNVHNEAKHSFSIRHKSVMPMGTREDSPMCLRLIAYEDNHLKLYVGYESTILQCFALTVSENECIAKLVSSTTTPHKEPLMAVDINYQDCRLYTCAADNKVCCFVLESNGAVRDSVASVQLPNPGASGIRYFGSCSLIAVAGWDYGVHLYTKSLEHIYTVRFHRAALTALSMSSQSATPLPETIDDIAQQRWGLRPQWLAVASRDTRISLWNIANIVHPNDKSS
ncbi:WD40 repeat-like protein [Coemansia reversa NRRL 1564]|uniref:ASTRA-associated protein 1 n=1 Tax=Coemansia reversa (strain ATCC 12441 / NRRL 1564) TaxID=763665 RepID=A0A2G5B482_COERN|nr:WD40 repeat-like protein [Coemansia reversa NRRL 1564]|eukprot:PIA13801.1 WD40 repeat-like protein [Coemansia reversa NRRL 1564]